MTTAAPGRIAVVRAGALGDVLLGFPALLALRRRFPEARIHLIGTLPQAALARDGGLVQSLAGVDDPSLGALFADGASLEALPADVRGVDLAVVWLRRPQEVARNLARLGAHAVLACPPWPDPIAGLHAAEWVLEGLRAIGVPPLWGWDGGPWLTTTPDAQQWAAEWTARHLDGSPFAVLHAGSGSARKNWPAASWARVLAALQERTALRLVLSAGPADGPAVEALLRQRRRDPAAAPPGPDVVLQGASLPRLGAVLQRARLMLGHDSGVTHLAAGLGVPTVAVFGPSDPALWRPRGPRVCVLGGTPSAPTRAAAVPGVAPHSSGWPEEPAVLAAALQLLEGARAAGGG
ncbi:MAG TPA: glycosyltransferase family 9 protein [Chloroflexota bacterium]|nr:glycosyltransferase family 9 protein [Chloroflexota bacterium]